jgi:hypothetical protein
MHHTHTHTHTHTGRVVCASAAGACLGPGVGEIQGQLLMRRQCDALYHLCHRGCGGGWHAGADALVSAWHEFLYVGVE